MREAFWAGVTGIIAGWLGLILLAALSGVVIGMWRGLKAKRKRRAVVRALADKLVLHGVPTEVAEASAEHLLALGELRREGVTVSTTMVTTSAPHATAANN